MNTKDTLLAYSEWLDSQGLIVGESDGDDRSHDSLADDFIEQWKGQPLAGQEPTVPFHAACGQFHKVGGSCRLLED